MPWHTWEGDGQPDCRNGDVNRPHPPPWDSMVAIPSREANNRRLLMCRGFGERGFNSKHRRANSTHLIRLYV